MKTSKSIADEVLRQKAQEEIEADELIKAVLAQKLKEIEAGK